MRNLKKVLSLSLALVMLLGMMVVGAGAATTYTDADDITYTEAVDVMSAVGVFNGTDAGDFQPNGDLTREQAAKIICYMLMGQTAADALSTNTAPFQDVAANRWSAGSIAYCVTMGIVAGDGNGKFYPTQTVTGYQFAKMLLVALGYDATVETYTGTNWAINVASDAASADLTVGLDASLTNTLTREQACQMAFNAVKADMVNYSNKGTNITINGVTIAQGASDAEPVVSSKDTISDDGYLQFAEQYCSDLVLTASNTGTDAFGRPANIWTYDDEKVGTYSKDAKFTYTADTGASALASALRGYTVNATVTKNGDVQTGTLTSTSEIAKLTANGTAVELFADKKVITDVVVIETEYATVSKVITTSGKESVSLTGGVQITLEDEPELYAVVEDLTIDAGVLVVKDAKNNALAVSIPETVTGEFTKINSGANSTYVVGGNTYGASAKLSGDPFASTNLTKTYVLTLDNYGYVIDASESALTDTNSYALVLDNSYSGSVMSGVTKYVQLLFTDGTIEWVQVATVGGKEVKNDTTDVVADFTFVAYAENNNGTYALSTTSKIAVNGKSTPAASLSNGIQGYTFTTDTSNFYQIKKNSTSFMKHGTTTGAETNLVNFTGSNSTVFLIGSASRGYKAYTGIKNVPNQKDASGYVLAYNNIAKIVVINTGATSVSTDQIYIAGNYTSAYRDNSNTVYTYPAVVNGTVTTVDIQGNANAAIGMYTSVEYTGDIITTLGSAVNKTYNNEADEVVETATATMADADNTFEYKDGILTINNVSTVGAGTVKFYGTNGKTVEELTATGFNALAKNASADINGSCKLVVVYDSDGVFVTAVYVSYTEKGTPETPSTSPITISGLTAAKNAADAKVVVNFTTSSALAGTEQVKIELIKVSDFGLESSVGSETVTPSTGATHAFTTTTLTVPATGNYKVVVTVAAADGTVLGTATSVNFYATVSP